MAAPEPGSERRRTSRYLCAGSVSLSQLQTKYPINAGVADISEGGCYVELSTPWPVGTKVSVVLNIEGTAIRSKAEVRTAHPGVGMGIMFEQMSEPDRLALRELIAQCAKTAAATQEHD